MVGAHNCMWCLQAQYHAGCSTSPKCACERLASNDTKHAVEQAITHKQQSRPVETRVVVAAPAPPPTPPPCHGWGGPLSVPGQSLMRSDQAACLTIHQLSIFCLSFLCGFKSVLSCQSSLKKPLRSPSSLDVVRCVMLWQNVRTSACHHSGVDAVLVGCVHAQDVQDNGVHAHLPG